MASRGAFCHTCLHIQTILSQGPPKHFGIDSCTSGVSSSGVDSDADLEALLPPGAAAPRRSARRQACQAAKRATIDRLLSGQAEEVRRAEGSKCVEFHVADVAGRSAHMAIAEAAAVDACGQR